jgi:hypothetical protein
VNAAPLNSPNRFSGFLSLFFDPSFRSLNKEALTWLDALAKRKTKVVTGRDQIALLSERGLARMAILIRLPIFSRACVQTSEPSSNGWPGVNASRETHVLDKPRVLPGVAADDFLS